MAAADERDGADTILARGGTMLAGAAEPAREEPPRDEDAASPEPPPPRPRSRIAAALALLALAGLIAVGAALYLFWHRFETTVAERRAEIESLDTAIRRAHAEIANLSARVASNTSTLAGHAESEASQQAAIAGLERALEQAHASLRAEIQAFGDAPSPAFEVVDIERLLLIANDALALQRDPDLALEALRGADRRLRAADDPRYAETRRLLGAEIAALEAVARPDIAGMAYLLGGLQAQLGSLTPVAGPAAGSPAASATADASGEQRGWREFLNGVWQSLRSLVVIRRTGADEAPLLAPEQQQLLTQNLYLKLESARAALLAGDEANFRFGLRDAGAWLRTYYRTDTPAVAALLEQFEALQAIELRPQLPDISASLAALRAVAATKPGTNPGTNSSTNSGTAP
jgi:uroporphyrin-3 C-methyltransferase